MSDDRFIVIQKEESLCVKDTKTGIEWWDLGYDEGGAEREVDALNTANFPDAIIAIRHSDLDIVKIDMVLSAITAPLLARIAELSPISGA